MKDKPVEFPSSSHHVSVQADPELLAGLQSELGVISPLVQPFSLVLSLQE